MFGDGATTAENSDMLFLRPLWVCREEIGGPTESWGLVTMGACLAAMRVDVMIQEVDLLVYTSGTGYRWMVSIYRVR